MTCQNQFKLEVDGVSITVAERPQKITSGSVGVFRCAFSFSACWDGLSRTAVFKAHSKTSNSAAMIIREVLLDEEGEAEIPWECLSQKEYTLLAGVYGTNDGTVVMPTVWAELGSVLPGTTAANSGSPPTPSIYDQVLDVAKNAEKIAQDLREDAESGAFNGKPGDPGKPGAPGKDGGYYQPSVSEDGQLAFNPSQEDMPAVPSAYIKGPPGQDAPQIDDSRVSSATPWSSRQIVDTLAPEFEASGAVVTCNPVAGYPLHVVSQIMLVQGGEGDPSPDNVRPITGWTEAEAWIGGKNLLNVPSISAETGIATIDTWITSDVVLSCNYSSVTISSNIWRFQFKFMDGTSVYVLDANLESGSRLVNVSADNPIVQIMYRGIYITSGQITNIQLEFGTAATPYEPYNGSTITLPLGQTVYGGTLDWTTGVLTVGWISHTFNAADIVSENWQPTDTSMGAVIRVTSAAALPVQTTTEIPNVLCTSLKTISYGDIFSCRISEMAISRVQGGADNRFVIRLPLSLATTAADIKAWLIDNAVKVAYQIAEPFTIQLTPTEVLALSGTNTIYTDTGDTTVSGRADPNAIIQQLTQRIAALESAKDNTTTYSDMADAIKKGVNQV